MSNTKRPFVPYFLKKIDDTLLRNNPSVWQTRTHLVLFFTALFAVVLSLFCLLVFFDAKQYSSLSGWVSFTALIVFIGFVFWLIFLLRFNVFKRFGNWYVWDGLKSFMLYFISIGAMVAVCFIPAAIETYRANQQFGNEEIVNDINELNATACKLEYDILPLKWRAEKCKVVDKTPDIVTGHETDTVAINIVDSGSLYYNVIDTAELRRRLSAADRDSVVKVNDSVYVFYECPDYSFVRSYSADEYTQNTLLTSAQLYRTVIKNYQKPDRTMLTKRMNELRIKWAVNSRYSSYNEGYEPGYEPNLSYDIRIKKKYDLNRISYGIENAVEKKYDWKRNWESYLRVFYYITLVLTMLLFIFRHSTVKTFFLSLLAGVIVTIITGLMMLVNYDSTESSFLSFIVLYYIVFAGIGLSVFGAATRKAIQGIGLNLFFFMTPFMPVVFVALNESMRYSRRVYEPVVIAEPVNYALYYFIAEIIGALLLLGLMEPLFKRLYRRWFAAPEN